MSLVRDVSTVGSGTLASRLLGFLRDLGIAAVLGAGVASDAFFAVLQIVNFFRRLLAEGALNSAFVPIWLRIERVEGERGARRFLQEVLGAMVLAVGALTLIGLVLASELMDLLAPGFTGEAHALAANYLRIGAPYIGLTGIVAVLAAALNAQRRVIAVAFGVVAFNVILLAAVGWVAVFGGPSAPVIGATLAHAVVLGGLAQLAVTAAGLRGGALSLRPRFGFSSDTRRFFALALPGLVAAGIPQLKMIAGAIVASSSPAAVSWLYYANRLYELPLGVISIAIASVLVPAIAAGKRSNDGTTAAQSRAFEIAVGLALPAAVAFAVLAQPIAAALFERGAFGANDATAVAAALTAICLGLPGHALEKVLGAVSFAHEDTRTPMLAALAGLATAIAGSLALFPSHGHVGVAAAIGLSGWVGATLLGVILWRRGWLGLDRAAARRLPRVVVATVVMGVAIFGLYALTRLLLAPTGALTRLAVLALLVATGLAVYGASLRLLGVARLSDLISARSSVDLNKPF